MYSITSIVRPGAMLIAALLIPVIPAAAEVPPASEAMPPPAAAPVTGPAMDQIMRMAGFLSQLKSFSVDSRGGYDVVQDSGQKIEFGETRALTLVRPDRLRIELRESDGAAKTLVFDGKSVTVYDPDRKLFATAEVPGDLDRSIPYFVRDLGMRLPLAMLFMTTLPQEFERRIRSAALVETSVLDDVPCFHLAARGDTVDMQLWIPVEGDPVPRRILLTYKAQDGQPQYWAEFANWNLNPDPPDARFSLALPPDATRIAFLPRVSDTAAPGEQP